MARISSILAVLQRGEKGQGLVEYALILLLIAIVSILALTYLGNTISTTLSGIGHSV